jgi:glycosyltransferase involved in cell wall biosynthesis
MKILNINSYYYSSSVHRQLQKSLEKLQLDLLTYVPVARGYLPREECQYGLEEHVKRVECYNKNDRYIFHLKHFKILNNLEQNFDLNSYDILHAHSLFSNGYIAMKIKEKFGIPYIVAVRDTDVNTFFKKLIYLRSLGNKILSEAESIVFLSKTYRDHLIKKYVKVKNQDIILKKSYVIPNGIDKFWLENKGYPKTLNNKNDIKLLYVGAISKRKNILTTIKAINILKQKGYNIRFTLVGKVVNEVVYNEIQKLDFVKYIPPKQKDELLTIYQENDIYVMPSITETFGLVYPEAMSQGLPVIYSKGQGFDGQFEDGEVGFAVDCFDSYEMADRIINIVNNYSDISKRCIIYSDKFDWNKISKTYEKSYNHR